MGIERSLTVTRPPDEAFHYLADMEHEPRWNPWALEVTKVTSGPIGLGSRFRGRYKRFGEVEQVIGLMMRGHFRDLMEGIKRDVA